MHTIIGVMGGGSVDAGTTAVARSLGRMIAEQGWTLLTGGRDCGVMAAATAGAHEAGGLTVGVLPDHDSRQAAHHLDIPIVTGMGDARNVINVLSSTVVIALDGGAGTLSEVAHALKLGRPVITLGLRLGAPPVTGDSPDAWQPYRDRGVLVEADSPAHAIEIAARFVDGRGDIG